MVRTCLRYGETESAEKVEGLVRGVFTAHCVCSRKNTTLFSTRSSKCVGSRELSVVVIPSNSPSK